MNPLVKWAGGKRSELPVLKPHYPTGFTRVVEPFAGGAAVTWDLDGVPAVLNDVNGGLVGFYRALQDGARREAVRKALERIGARRLAIRRTVAGLSEAAVRGFFNRPQAWVARHQEALAGAPTLAGLDERFRLLLTKHADAKGGRVDRFRDGGAGAFPVNELRPHIETAAQSAWYETLREVYNGLLEVETGWNEASWWAVRVLCYSGMFRFSRKGHFNVPYGGTSYNARDFADSMDDLFGPARVAELQRLTVEALDFEALFQKHHGFASTDFVFVDPPYDSAFSRYNVEADFSARDQERLRDVLVASPARWMLVIKRTDFIEQLYTRDGVHLHVFGKTYAANFRNRHARDVEHLVATNYALRVHGDDPLKPL